MKEETKKKFCKFSKIVGFAITFSFAVFGALCAAMLIGNGGKKDDIKTLDSSLVQNEVRSEPNSKPRKAPDYGSAYNYIENGTRLDVYYNPRGSTGASFESAQGGYSVYFAPGDLPNGYYYVTGMNLNEYTAGMWGSKSDLPDIREVNWEPGVGTRVVTFLEGYSMEFNYNHPFYLYIDWSQHADDLLWFRYPASLYLVDTLELPVSSSLTFPESFSPLGLFGDSVTNNGGYVYLPNAEGNELDIEITGLIFKYGGVVYDGIHIECVRALSMGYINDDGQLVKQGGANDYMWALSWIKFYQRYKGQSPQDGIVVVMAELKSVTDNANDMPVAFTGRTQWVNRSDRTIQIIDDLGTITGRYDGRYSDMTDKNLLEWVSSSFSVGNSLGVMGNNSVFDIFTNAFDSVLPILSIAILPNITLGMLLFIPLIGAIIVIIIRVVKK